jgi:hypothetical protein
VSHDFGFIAGFQLGSQVIDFPARNPAPPAPTNATSKVWSVMV